MPEQMHVKIYAPFKVYYDAPADSLSATNDTGPFDILPHHKNFMSLLRPGRVIVRQKGQPDFNLNVDRAIMHVRDNEVRVFLDV